LNVFRWIWARTIWGRLEALEGDAAMHFVAITDASNLAAEDRAHTRTMFRAATRRMRKGENLVSSALGTPCARCRAYLVFDRVNEQGGPQLMEGATRSSNRFAPPEILRIVVCWHCEGAARRDGWKLVKLPPPTPAPALEPPKEQEAPA